MNCIRRHDKKECVYSVAKRLREIVYLVDGVEYNERNFKKFFEIK